MTENRTETAQGTATETLSAEDLKALEEKFDPEMRFRTVARPLAMLAAAIMFLLSCYHYYTAGFGIPPATTHRGLHMGVTLLLVFLSFSAFGRREVRPGPLAPWGMPLIDWILAGAGLVAALYVPWIYADLAFRVGNPLPVDIAMGTILIVVLLEAVRRSMGWPLPVIAILFIAYAYFGRSMPGILVHPGASWSNIVNHLYLTSQGIYGTALGVIATYVFHFVLFGVMASRIGLGQLFIDIASALAGRYAGGPAKVSVVSSALLGSISGSSIANTVTTGALTIPAMIRIGYPRHFAAAVEAASSTGGQITPPVMGAVAFLMIEYLGVPLTTILTAALVPAFMHFFGVLVQVHLEARRLGLRGLHPSELPNAWRVFRKGWLSVLPLILLIAILLSGRTPFAAAFWSITACIGVLLIQKVLASGLVDGVRAAAYEVWEGFVLGARQSLAVTAAAALVGVVIGVVTLTGVGFKIAYMVTGVASGWANDVHGWLAVLPVELMTVPTLTLLFTLMLTAVVCILMGCGIPTTANYIIMVAVAAPILGLLGVQPLVAHFFVFYYGVLADITPPVAMAAYAASGIAGANAFKAGNTAFRLGMGKVLVPFVFAFQPALLLVTDGFTWSAFFLAAFGAVMGIWALAAAVSNWLFAPLHWAERILLVIAALLLVAPDTGATVVGLALFLPPALRQLAFRRRSMA
ncbi:TRAP transporter permease [Rhodovulum sp. BSW8]|uniref:TRAP transporter 4TM/12TM fusion protein n=1 Tax=Rhodovulum visakhapatnamense TaxID=364297 RepID=A0A4R8G934_9RHOB|nr:MULTISPECIES: TRAP transporter permease [Rhodovulum]OLS43257.1 C4-dicarboxylate ABC transporter permease [Rhodovulum sulfidophilum]MBL3568312.1 TRAP transporter permease [Rhodovulum visakhapatnamense]MBL3578837.1 TRAP transporter permease [Rhodovulum visakhapatnamense]RBO53220.1 TRAP transporter permease [Rhodovulum sp. BSW8]TDX31986.1 TRAP transporter 4TM/12TM fusion protein [Rhodovulum visakhapatnamense]